MWDWQQVPLNRNKKKLNGVKMGVYKYLQQLWNKPKKELAIQYKEKMLAWRHEEAVVRLQHPTRLDRARALGFKAKQGFFVVRSRVTRGGHIDKKRAGGRRSKNFSRSMALNLNYQEIAQRRANQKYPNCEVLNSYWVGKDKSYYYYEIIMIDTQHPVVKADKHLMGLKNQTSRAFRGLTSASRKSRALQTKGIGAEKARPSRNAHKGKIH